MLQIAALYGLPALMLGIPLLIAAIIETRKER